MNCKQTREAIDDALRSVAYGASVTSHLSGCPDCRRHADETTSLLALLTSQPRVQVPADFDFKLRARIARAQAEKAAPAGFFEGIWERYFTRTFSWGQAATAMAAVMLVGVFSTLYINHDNGAPVTSGDVAVVNPAPEPPQARVEAAREIKPPVVEVVRQAPTKLQSRSVKTTPAVYNPDDSMTAEVSGDIASADQSTRVYSRETRQIVQDRDAMFGAQLVSVNTTKSAPAALTF